MHFATPKKEEKGAVVLSEELVIKMRFIVANSRVNDLQ